jgi:hypothetical protein
LVLESVVNIKTMGTWNVKRQLYPYFIIKWREMERIQIQNNVTLKLTKCNIVLLFQINVHLIDLLSPLTLHDYPITTTPPNSRDRV